MNDLARLTTAIAYLAGRQIGAVIVRTERVLCRVLGART